MHSKLSYYQHQKDCYNYKDVLCKPHGKYKPKTYSTYTNNKEKGLNACHYRKLLKHRRREQKRKKGTNEA